MQKLNILYFGTPALSAEVLKLLLNDSSLPITIKAIVTQPDKKVGRKQILTPSSVKVLAKEHNIPVIENLEELKTLQNIDLAILFAYGKIIPEWLLTLPKFGFWNIHPSLLPKYRGASPTTFPLLMGESQTGVTLMQMDAQLDHGDIIEQKEFPISDSDTKNTVEKQSVEIAFDLLKKYLGNLSEQKNIPHSPQNHEYATFTRLLQKKDGYIPFSLIKAGINGVKSSSIDISPVITEYRKKFSSDQLLDTPAMIIDRLFRALSPWPGTWTMININSEEKRLKITDVILEHEKLIIKKVQLEGKKEVDWETFQKAYSLR